MKNTLISLFLLLGLASCGSVTSYQSDQYQDTQAQKDCAQPENPYTKWWHSAGYDWARKTGWSCNGNSDAFNEWCEEYYAQKQDYQNCIK